MRTEQIDIAKQELRRVSLARRDAMPEVERIEASLMIADLGADVLGFDPGAVVSGFLPIRSEVDIRPLMMRLGDRGARLCVPAIVRNELEFRHLLRDAPLEPQGFGTSAPGEHAAILDPQIMLVPLAAFDRAGGRIGYGRGFYDRAIAALRAKGIDPILFGVAYAVQEVPSVPMAEHDIPMPRILTEQGLIEAV